MTKIIQRVYLTILFILSPYLTSEFARLRYKNIIMSTQVFFIYINL